MSDDYTPRRMCDKCDVCGLQAKYWGQHAEGGIANYCPRHAPCAEALCRDRVNAVDYLSARHRG